MWVEIGRHVRSSTNRGLRGNGSPSPPIRGAQRNLTVWTFLDPEARTRYVDWSAVAADNAAILRLDAASAPDDPQLAAIVGMLSLKSAEFRQAWNDHHVFECTYGRKSFDHPVTGRFDLDYEALPLPAAPGQMLHVYTANPGSPADRALRKLGKWASPTADLASLFDGPTRGSPRT